MWIWIVTAAAGGFLLGRSWTGWAVRWALRNDPEIVEKIQQEYGRRRA